MSTRKKLEVMADAAGRANYEEVIRLRARVVALLAALEADADKLELAAAWLSGINEDLYAGSIAAAAEKTRAAIAAAKGK